MSQQNNLLSITFTLNPLEHHNLRIMASKHGLHLGPFVSYFLRKELDLKREKIPELNPGLHAPADVNGTTKIAPSEQ